MRTEDIATEVFFFPAAAHTEKDGTFTNTQRMVQWHHKAVEPQRRPAPRPVVHLPPRAAASASGWRARPTRWTGRCSTSPGTTRPRARTTSPSAEAVLAEINGWNADGELLSAYTAAASDDGSTSCGCWIYCGCYADGVNQTARRKPGARAELDRRGVGVGVAGQPPDPLQPRLGRPAGQAVVRAQGARLVGRRAAAAGPATTRPTSRSTSRRTTGPPTDAIGPDGDRRRRPVHHAGRRPRLAVRARRRRRRAAADPLRAAGLAGAQPAAPPAAQPGAPGLRAREQPLPPRSRRARVPTCSRTSVTTYRLTEHFTAGGHVAAGRRTWPSCSPSSSARSRPSWPPSARLEHGGWATIVSARGVVEARVMVTDRMTPLQVDGRIGPPDRDALPLGPERLRARRLDERAVVDVARPELPHPGGQGADRRHPARAAARAGPRAERSSATTASAPGSPPRRGWRHERLRRLRSTSCCAAGDPATAAGYEEHPPRMGFFTDTSVCIGCKACEVACKEWNGVPEDGLNWTGWSHDNSRRARRRHLAPRRLHRAARARSAATSTNFQRDDDDFRWLMSSDVCKHCTHAACLDVCPTGAIFRTEFGTVVVQADVCNGCGYCVPGLPLRRARQARGRRAHLQVHALLRPARGRAGAGLRQGLSDRLDPVRRARAAARARRARGSSSCTRRGSTEARLYGHDPDDGVGGDGAFFLLLDEPEVYGLPPDPVVTTRDLPAMWKRVGHRRRARCSPSAWSSVARSAAGERRGGRADTATATPTTATRSSTRRSGRSATSPATCSPAAWRARPRCWPPAPISPAGRGWRAAPSCARAAAISALAGRADQRPRPPGAVPEHAAGVQADLADERRHLDPVGLRAAELSPARPAS